MKRRTGWILGLSLLSLVAAVAIACGDDDDDDAVATPAASSVATAATTASAQGTVIDVVLNEFAVVPDKTTVPAGSITFNATNQGPDDEHEFVIIRSDLAPGALPTSEDGSVPEDEVDFVDEIEGLAVGASGSVTVDLAAGKYVLICNIVQTEPDGTIESHYQQGMRNAFTVE